MERQKPPAERVHEGVKQGAAAQLRIVEKKQAELKERSKAGTYTAEELARMTAYERVGLGAGLPLPPHREAAIRARPVQVEPPPKPKRYVYRQTAGGGLVRNEV